MFSKHQPRNVHVSGVFSLCWRFLQRLCSDLSRQMKSLLSLNWQVLKVLMVKFPAFTSDQFHHLLINVPAKELVHLSLLQVHDLQYAFCSQYYSWANSHRGRLKIAFLILYLHCSGCTPTQHVQSKLDSDFALRQWFSTFFEPGPTFIFKKISGPTGATTCQKYLFFLRHYTACYVIWIINAHTRIANFTQILCHTHLTWLKILCQLISNPALDADYISFRFEVPF